MTAARRITSHVLLGLGLAGLAGVIYWKAEPIDFTEHRQFEKSMLEIRTVDATVNQDVLKARYRLLNDYDSLAEDSSGIQRCLAALRNIPDFVSRDGRGDLERNANDLAGLLAKKFELIERFKSQNAVLNNSLAYFPGASGDLLARLENGGQNKDLEWLFNELTREVLVFSLTTNEELPPDLQATLKGIAAWRLANPEHPEAQLVASLTTHAAAILRRKPILEALTREILEVPTIKENDELERAYHVEVAARLNLGNSYRLYLYLVSTVLGLGIGYTIYALWKANASLEQRVRERAKALYGKNEELQREIVERVRTEGALKTSEQRFREIAETIEDVFWITSADLHEIHYVSQAFETVWGQPAQALYERPLLWTEAIFDEDKEAVFKAFGQLSAAHTTVSVEYRIHSAAGDFRWIADRGFLVLDADGQPCRIVGVARDITEHKRTEAEIRQLERKQALIFNSIGEGIHWIDRDGQIIFENPAAARMLGWEVEDLVGRPAHATIHHSRGDGTPYPKCDCPIYAGLVTGEVRHVNDEVFWRKDGTSFPVEYTSTPVRDENDEPMGVVVVFVDITERKRLEAELHEANKLQTVGRLAGGIAHDFNTILTSIIGHAELIRDAAPPGGELSRSAGVIGQSATRAATLTQQLLAFGRKQLLQPELIDINKVVADAGAMLRHLVGEAIDVRCLPNAEHCWTKADANQIQQVIVQLAMNARDAMPGGGCLTLETADCLLDEVYAARHSEVVAGDYVVIAMSDTGRGIPEDVKPHLFEPFFTTKAQGEGTGLGLAMCYGVAKQIGGHLTVESEIGRGTTFKIYLPRHSAAPLAPPVALVPAVHAPSSQGKETILLVEDDSNLRELATIVLQKLRYTVHPAANGLEAIRIAEQMGGIDLLLTDLNLPQMGGKELAAHFSSSFPSVKVLFTSADTKEAIVHHHILGPEVEFLHKPYTPLALTSQTRRTLDGKSNGGTPKGETALQEA